MGSPMKPLPFKCHGLREASQAHVEVAKKASADKCEVLFPIGLPDEGTFDWLDQFLEKNPQYTELSDRKIIEWANRAACGGTVIKEGERAATGMRVTTSPTSTLVCTAWTTGSVQKSSTASLVCSRVITWSWRCGKILFQRSAHPFSR